MQVVLKVVGGKNDGREITIAVPRFIIGRGDTAHLRPASDLVSREHCEILVSDGSVIINDLKSRNGTFVNGKRIKVADLHDATFSITGLGNDTAPRSEVTLTASSPDGATVEVQVVVRLDTPVEIDYYRAGGILPYVLAQILEG